MLLDTNKRRHAVEDDLLASMEWMIEQGFAVEWVDSQWLRYALLLSRVLDRSS